MAMVAVNMCKFKKQTLIDKLIDTNHFFLFSFC